MGLCKIMDRGERPISDSFASLPLLMTETYKVCRQYVSEKEVLDVGCGQGFVTAYLGEAARRAVGIDVDQKVIGEATRRFSHIGNVGFYKMSGDKLNFPPASFDVVVSAQSIEHIKDDAAFLKEVSRVLRKEGVFICATPNKLSIVPEGEKVYEAPFYPFHSREYTPQQFFGLLGGYFREIEKKGLYAIKKNPEFKKSRRFKLIYRTSRFAAVRWLGRHVSARIKRMIWFLGKRQMDVGDTGFSYGDYNDELVPEHLIGICRGVLHQ